MHRTRSLLVAAAFAALVAPSVHSQEPTPAPVAVPQPVASKPAAKKVAVYDETADARAEVKAALQRATLENRRVLIQWGANWCHWCVLLSQKMGSDRALQKQLSYEYDVVKIDVGQFDKNLDLAKELGADFKAIPYLTILGADGKAIVQQNTEPFETKEGNQGGHDAAKLLTFLKQHAASPLDAEQVLADGLAAAKTSGKRVFLHFGAPWCPWCHQLDNWMREATAAALLQRDFVDVKIDTDRMTNGQAVLDAQRQRAGSKGGGIPWIVFLDGDGAQLATSDGPDGNIGFPAKPEEIAWFASMVAKVKVNLKDEDVEALKALLVAWGKAKGLTQNH